MLTPHDFIARWASLCDEMVENERRGSQAVSMADKAVSEIYHKIESSRFSAAEGYWLAKRLKDALVHRRTAKMELERLQILMPYVRNMIEKQRDVVSRLSQREATQDQYLEVITHSAKSEVAAASARPNRLGPIIRKAWSTPARARP